MAANNELMVDPKVNCAIETSSSSATSPDDKFNDSFQEIVRVLAATIGVCDKENFENGLITIKVLKFLLDTKLSDKISPMYKSYLGAKLAGIDTDKIATGTYDPVICQTVKTLLTFGNDISFSSWVDLPVPLDDLVGEFASTSFKFVLNGHRLCMEATATTSPSLSARLHSAVSAHYDLANYVPNKYDSMELIGPNLVFVRLNLITTWIKKYAGRTFKVKPVAIKHRAITENSLHSYCAAVEVAAPELDEFISDFNIKFNLKTVLTYTFNIGRTYRTLFNAQCDSFDDTAAPFESNSGTVATPKSSPGSSGSSEKEKKDFTYNNRRGTGKGRGGQGRGKKY